MNSDEKIVKALEPLTNTIREEMRQGFLQTDKNIDDLAEQNRTEHKQILEQSKKDHKQILDILY